MGDRGIIVVTSKAGRIGSGIYVHNHGDHLVVLLREAIPFLRADDVSYSTARLCAFLANKIDGNTGLGICAPPANLEPKTLEQYSPGDGGVVVYNCSTGDVYAIGGYLCEPVDPDEKCPERLLEPKRFPIPPE